jgi:hypothetical protein
VTHGAAGKEDGRGWRNRNDIRPPQLGRRLRAAADRGVLGGDSILPHVARRTPATSDKLSILTALKKIKKRLHPVSHLIDSFFLCA